MATWFPSRAFPWLVSTGLSALLLGCPAPEGQYDEFVERHVKRFPPAEAGAGYDCPEPGLPEAGEIDGTFLFVFSATMDPGRPVLFSADLHTAEGADGLELTIDMQPIDAYDRQTLVGDLYSGLGPFAVDPDTQEYHAELGSISLPGEANPFSEKPLAATGILDGKLCKGDFLCGDLSGEVTAPITYPLPGSTYTFDRADGSVFPDPPVINCDGEEAREPPDPP